MLIKEIIKLISPNFYYFMHVKKADKFFYSLKNKEEYTKLRYKSKFNIDLNLDNPETFYEKINYLKLFYNEENGSQLVDKVLVKEYLSNEGYGDIFAKTIASFKRFKDFSNYIRHTDKKQFVVKLNHTSGDVFFFDKGKWRDKRGENISRRLVFAILKQKLKLNYYHLSLEKQYNDIIPQIFIEEYIPSFKQKGLMEYKFFCNFGNVKFINVVRGRQSADQLKEAFVDPDLNKFETYQKEKMLTQEEISKPECFEKMVSFCEKETKNRPLIRVDLMTNGKDFYFCEFTFYDCGGMNIFHPLEMNKKLGDLINIKNIINSSEK